MSVEERKRNMKTWEDFGLLVTSSKEWMSDFLDGYATGEKIMTKFGAGPSRPHCEDCIYNFACIPFCRYLWNSKKTEKWDIIMERYHFIPKDIYCGKRPCPHFSRVTDVSIKVENAKHRQALALRKKKTLPQFSEKHAVIAYILNGGVEAAEVFIENFIDAREDIAFAEKCFALKKDKSLAYTLACKCFALDNPEKGIQWLRTASQLGHIGAASDLGLRYAEGKGVSQDFGWAVYWYSIAGDRNDNCAWCNLGRMYIVGKGVPKDEKKGLTLIKKAAKVGNPAAMNNLGYLYMEGIGICKNKKKAFSCFQKAAEMGDAAALNNLGYCYSVGVGCAVNHELAVKSFLKAVDAGEQAFAAWNLAREYTNHNGFEFNYDKARFYKELAAKNGHAPEYPKLYYLD